MTTLGLSLVMFATGLILRFAVTAHVDGFRFHAAGNCLIVIGLVGIVIGLVEWLVLRPRPATR